MTRRFVGVAFAAGLAAGAAACQTTAGAAAQEAVLLEQRDETLVVIKETIEKIIGPGRVNLGPVDLTRNSVIAVLPPKPGPYEGNSPAMPRYFELMTDGERCYVRERGEATLHTLTGIRCRPQSPR